MVMEKSIFGSKWDRHAIEYNLDKTLELLIKRPEYIILEGCK